jgi:hypothetical protein
VNFSHGYLFDGRKYTFGLGIKKQQLNILNCCVGFVTKKGAFSVALDTSDTSTASRGHRASLIL